MRINLKIKLVEKWKWEKGKTNKGNRGEKEQKKLNNVKKMSEKMSKNLNKWLKTINKPK